MSKELTRTTNPFAEMMEWWDLAGPRDRKGVGLAPQVRVVTVQGDVLTIRGERREQKKDRNHQEFHDGSFSRSVTLPAGADPDAVDASYTDGVLEVRVPMTAPEAGTRTVPVTRS
ncbi:Hsp20/alpha crystallin family protein [Ornithinimicrobium flavum]|uniref:Hsp20/alpha crystallin family protein n=1 Tax=Ornithinimicrobium flavum TaxID=1288636 RepID=UPI00106FB2D9|nr:Hsp20 family protein [Ornithinimicrobium flavum]